MSLSGSALGKIMDRKEIYNSELARQMGVTPPTVAYWLRCAEVPPQRLAALESILGPLTIPDERDPKSWVREFKTRYYNLQQDYHFSPEDLADTSELSPLTIRNILNDVTSSPQERTIDFLDNGLDILRAGFEESAEHAGDSAYIDADADAISFLQGRVKVLDANSTDIYERAGVYMLYGANAVTHRKDEKKTPFLLHGAPEYVGHSKSIKRRIREHERVWWYNGVVWLAYVELRRKKRRKWLEAILIQLLNPQFNKQRPI